MLDVSAEWTEDSHELSQNTSMKYDIRVTCESNYYGGGCADLCRPRDDQFGHYTCSSNGDIVCLSGWQGEYCTKREYNRTTHLTRKKDEEEEESLRAVYGHGRSFLIDTSWQSVNESTRRRDVQNVAGSSDQWAEVG